MRQSGKFVHSLKETFIEDLTFSKPKVQIAIGVISGVVSYALALYMKHKDHLTFSSEESTMGFLFLQLMLIVIFSVVDAVMNHLNQAKDKHSVLAFLFSMLAAILVVFMVEYFIWTICIFVPFAFYYLLFSGRKLYFRYYMITLSIVCSFVMFL